MLKTQMYFFFIGWMLLLYGCLNWEFIVPNQARSLGRQRWAIIGSLKLLFIVCLPQYGFRRRFQITIVYLVPGTKPEGTCHSFQLKYTVRKTIISN